VTSVDRALSESERQFLQQIKQWKKKVVVALSKIDILRNADDLQEILEFVRINIEPVIGSNPVIFPVSSKLALEVKSAKRHSTKPSDAADVLDDKWQASRFGELEKYILETLDAGQRARIKLLNPLGVAEALIEKYKGLIHNQGLALHSDRETLTVVDRNIDAHIASMKQGML
jgi:sulfur relay (sulfurtransferase) DsrC/TusE family protein